MSLGEAFIEVRADMRPFIRDLDRQVMQAVRRVEQATNQAFTNSFASASQQAGQAGQRAGTSFSRGLQNSLFFGGSGGGGKNIFIALASSLASALDDGISALPTEVKAAIVGGALLAAPTLGAILGAAIATSLGLAVAGIGTLLAFQFEDVQERAVSFGREAREILAGTAIAFGPAVLNAIDLIENRLESLAPVLTRVFDVASKFVEPITTGLLQGVEAFVDALDSAVPNLQPFIDTFSIGLQQTLEMISEGLRRLANTGEMGTQALQDLFFVVNLLIAAFFGTINLLIIINDLFHKLLNFARELSPILDIIVRILQSQIPDAGGAVVTTNLDAAASFNGLVAATNDEEKAARDLVRAMKELSDATYENIQVDVDFERSLDRISESLRENGKTLDIHNEKGRRNVESFLRGLKDAEERALSRLKTQGYTSEQAAALYNQEIAQLRQVARQAGITDEQFNLLFEDIVEVSGLRISSEDMGVDDLAGGLDNAAANAKRLLDLIRTIRSATISGAVGGVNVKGFADGDIVNRPTLGVFGEAGPEVIIPLTKPARAAELANKSGLSALLGSNGSVVLVYIGNEQLDSHVVRVVEGSNNRQALALSHGGRSL